jgi:hypothetical protein
MAYFLEAKQQPLFFTKKEDANTEVLIPWGSFQARLATFWSTIVFNRSEPVFVKKLN